MRPIKKDSTNQSVVLRIIDDTDGTPENSVVWDTAGIDLWYRREGATKTSITEATLAALNTAHTDGGFKFIGDGYYRLDLPDAAVATGANGVMIGGTVTGMIVIGTYIPLVDYNPYDAVRLGLTALPNANADAGGGLPISDAGGLDLDAKLANTNEITAARMATLTDLIDGGRLDLLIDDIKAKTDELIIHETTIASVTDDKTFVLTASGLDGDTSADDDAWNDASVVITDVTGTAKELRKVADYGGVAKRIVLDRVCKFNLAAGDKVKFYPAYTSTASAGSVTQQNIDDIVAGVYNANDMDFVAQGSKGQKIHHSGKGR